MPRFFVDQPLEGQVFLGGEDGRHLAKSLRVRPGEEVTLCDGRGADALCKVLSTQGEGALLQVEETSPSQGEPQTKVTVCQCWCKGDKLETVTQKAVELGAVEIWPLESARCGVIPQVLAPASLKQALEEAARQGEILFFYERGEESLRQALRAAGERLFVFVGPEGGFAPEEAALAQSLGAKLLTLGPRILRTETAPLAALSAIFYEKGDMERRGEAT